MVAEPSAERHDGSADLPSPPLAHAMAAATAAPLEETRQAFENTDENFMEACRLLGHWKAENRGNAGRVVFVDENRAVPFEESAFVKSLFRSDSKPG